MSAPLFSFGRVVATPAALTFLAGAGENPAELLARHQNGDWSVVPPADVKEIDFSVKRGLRILSSYAVGCDGERVWINEPLWARPLLASSLIGPRRKPRRR